MPLHHNATEIAWTSTLRVVAYTHSPDSKVWYYQVNVPYEHWTETMRNYFFGVALAHQGLEEKEKQYVIAPGSGAFFPGMNDIFYLMKKR